MGAAKQPTTKRWTKPQYRKEVEKWLRDYPYLKESIEDREMIDLFPSCVPVYGEENFGGGGGFSSSTSSTERYGIKRAERWEKQLWVRRIEKALDALDPDERGVIEKTYFDGLPQVIVCSQLKISEATCRRIKARAINKLALILNLK
ncbi:RinA family phage transcriptional activator [Laceyella sacchari]|uniref:sigma-70 family RNA polymerase sigma factor n=1 Tax=Laceyella sacchari TaxID=37482 RepID=UPI000A766318|nr:sigma-70 family RNA polymerase sigma factor [Laceyella sacchari]TCW35315.1 RinA family phage transcriptional activator [Laceyella sacchari]